MQLNPHDQHDRSTILIALNNTLDELVRIRTPRFIALCDSSDKHPVYVQPSHIHGFEREADSDVTTVYVNDSNFEVVETPAQIKAKVLEAR